VLISLAAATTADFGLARERGDERCGWSRGNAVVGGPGGALCMPVREDGDQAAALLPRPGG
jgi:hypothetical protein